MRENLPENLPSRDDLREKFIEEYLLRLENKQPIKIGEIVVVLHGPYALQGMMVEKTTDKETVFVLPSPESKEAIEFKVSEVYTFDDYHNALKVALDRYKFTTKELGVDIPDAMKN